jgi:hypothetical protein
VGDSQCQAPKASAIIQGGSNKFSFLLHKTFHLTAFAQDTSIDSSDSIGNNNDTSGNVDVGFNPATDVVHRIHISYDKPSKDILVSYPIQNEVTLVAADPAPNEDYKNNPNISSVSWSVKKVLNPGKTAAELQNITLPALPSGGMTFKLTLRPKPGIKDVYIISQAKITLNPLSSSGAAPTGTTGGTAPSGGSTGEGCLQVSDPTGTDWATINSLDSLFTQKINEVTKSIGACVPVNLVKALVYEESGGGMIGENGAGYSGIMQVGPDSWCDHDLYDIGTSEGNVGCGVSHLAHRQQPRSFRGGVAPRALAHLLGSPC